MRGAAIGASALVEEKVGTSSSGAVSGSTNEYTPVSAVTVVTYAVSGEVRSAALTKAGTAAMSRMNALRPREQQLRIESILRRY